MCMIPLAVAAIIWRRRLMRLERQTQWLVAAAAIFTCVLMFGLFVRYVQ
jgi:hypothetical protein